ncbi:MAG TPA: hypothetical protein VME44_22300 [Streptosporangiaceae bacterium]|nr:hypothetical protein [Streptosporangiaceae bacterium]
MTAENGPLTAPASAAGCSREVPGLTPPGGSADTGSPGSLYEEISGLRGVSA